MVLVGLGELALVRDDGDVDVEWRWRGVCSGGEGGANGQNSNFGTHFDRIGG